MQKKQMMKFDLANAAIELHEHFFDAQESGSIMQALISEIDWKQYQIKIFGKTLDQPRLTAYYGEGHPYYAYSNIKLQPIPFTPILLSIKNKIEALTLEKFNGVLLNYYRNGDDSMGWHADDEKELGTNPVIASLSFGASRNFQLQHSLDKSISKATIVLNDASLLIMQGETQHFWKHQIPKQKNKGPRINLTFRKIIY
jgi:alkylated DNA repair dioxygenase AlkB